MSEKEEIEKLLRDRDRLLEEVERRSREIRAINLQTAAILNERVKMIEELQQRKGELEILLAIAQDTAQLREPEALLQTALDKVLEFLSLERGFAALLGEEEGKFSFVCHRGFSPPMAQQIEQARPDRGLIDSVLRSEQTILVENIGNGTTRDELQVAPEPGMHSLIIAVLRGREKALGVLSVSSTRQRLFTSREKELLLSVAGQIGIALDNALLFHQVRQSAQRIEAISNLTRTVCTSLKLSEVYEVFVQELKKLVDFDRCSIALAEGEEARTPLVYTRLDSELRAGARRPMKGSALAWMMEHKKSLVEADLSQERLFTTDELHLKSGLRSSIRVPLFHQGEVFGALNVMSTRPNAYGEREREILEEVAGEIASAIRNDMLFEELTRRQGELEESYRRLEEHAAALQESLREQQRAYLQVADTLVRLVESRHPAMQGHSERVARYARLVSRQMGLSQPEERKVELAARLHDVGMLAVPESLWFKREGLSPKEQAQMEPHATVLAETLMSVPFLRDALPLVRAHHERYDGKGYPDSLRGDSIPLGARVIAVADAYDAMTSERPYRHALSSEEALETLKKGAGTQWDPRVVEAFLLVIRRGEVSLSSSLQLSA